MYVYTRISSYPAGTRTSITAVVRDRNRVRLRGLTIKKKKNNSNTKYTCVCNVSDDEETGDTKTSNIHKYIYARVCILTNCSMYCNCCGRGRMVEEETGKSSAGAEPSGTFNVFVYVPLSSPIKYVPYRCAYYSVCPARRRVPPSITRIPYRYYYYTKCACARRQKTNWFPAAGVPWPFISLYFFYVIVFIFILCSTP